MKNFSVRYYTALFTAALTTTQTFAQDFIDSNNDGIADFAVADSELTGGFWDNQLLRTGSSKQGWTGADGIYSIPLSGVDRPNGSLGTLFTFADTYLSIIDDPTDPYIASPGMPGPSPMLTEYGRYALPDFGIPVPGQPKIFSPAIVNNSVAHSNFWGFNINFRWGSYFNPKYAQFGPIKYASVYRPSTEEINRENSFYWTADSIRLPNHNDIYTFALKAKYVNGTRRDLSMDLIKSEWQGNVDSYVASAKTYRESPFFREDGNRALQSFGESKVGYATMVNTQAAGAPAPDGYVYVYGVFKENGGLGHLIATRVRPQNIERFDQYEVYTLDPSTGESYWKKGAPVRNAKPIADGLSFEFSMTPLTDGSFLLVYAAGGSGPITYRRCSSPVNCETPVNVFTCPDLSQYPAGSISCYNAKAHPHLSQTGKLLISYNVIGKVLNFGQNTFDMNNYDGRIYRPRFVWLYMPGLL